MEKPTGKPARSREASIEDYGGHTHKQSVQEWLTERLAAFKPDANGAFDAMTTLERFFLAELLGYTISSRERDKVTALMHLSHALLWARALDERHEATHGDAYRAFRDAHELGSVVRGIRYARNRVVHDIPELFYLTEGTASFPLEFPATFFEYRWQPLAALPPPERPDPRGQEAYVQRLATTPVRHTLRGAEQFFMGARFHLIQGGSDVP